MKRIASFIVSGYSPAVLCTVGFAWLSVLIPVGTLMSAAVIGLVGLQFGWQRTFLVGILSVACLAAVHIFMSGFNFLHGALGPELLIILSHWIPVFILSQALRSTGSLSYTIQGLVFFMVSVILLSFWMLSDSAAVWNNFFNWLSNGKIIELIESSPEVKEQYQIALDIMTGIVATSMALIWVLSLLLARWWQSLLLQPGSFAQEFTKLQLGKVIAVCGLLFLSSTFLGKSLVVIEVVALLMMIFMIQGIATVHFLLNKTDNGKIFLFIFYGALILSVRMPVLPSLIAVFGMLENFISLRKRMTANS